MSDVVLSTTESVTTVTVVDDIVQVAVTTNPVTVTTQTVGVQGASYNFGDPIYVTVRNATGATLTKGTIVYTAGAQGNHTLVQKANASGDATSARTLGWVSADIANNSDGFVIVEGYLDGIDTDHIAEGSQLYLSGTVAGSFTATKPVAPIHLVYVGVVTKSNPGNGRVLVKIQNGYEISELHDVQIINPVNNQVLTYDSATDLWVNATNPADGVTSITATAPLTGGTITSTGSIGLDQTALSIAQSQVSNLTTDLAGKANLAGGNALTGAQTITGTVAGSRVLTLTGASGQTADLFSVTGTVGTTSINNQGLLVNTGPVQTNGIRNPSIQTVIGLTASGITVLVNNPTTGNIAYAVRGAANQVEDLTEWQNSSGTTLGGRNANAQIFTGSVSPIQTAVGAGINGVTGNGTTVTFSTTNAHGLANGDRVTIAGLTPAGYNGTYIISGVSTFSFNIANTTTGTATGSGTVSVDAQTSITARSAGTIGLQVRGATSQAADLLRFVNAGGTTLSWFNAGGSLFMGGSGTLISAVSGRAAFITNDAAQVPMLIRGAASQSANLLELQNSAGTIQASIDASGMANLLRGNFRGAVYGTGTYFGAVNVLQESGGHGVVIQGRDSQTTDILRIRMGATPQAGNNALLVQNSSGTARARIDQDGNLFAQNVGGINQLVFLRENNSGGGLEMRNQTAAAPNPGNGRGTLYFRDGTNAGTLKLVVRAGAAGAETTILDNIPQ